MRRVCCAAACQRNLLEHAPGLAAQQDELLEALLEFFEQTVQERFPCANYTFDVYVTIAGRVRARMDTASESPKSVGDACIRLVGRQPGSASSRPCDMRWHRCGSSTSTPLVAPPHRCCLTGRSCATTCLHLHGVDRRLPGSLIRQSQFSGRTMQAA